MQDNSHLLEKELRQAKFNVEKLVRHGWSQTDPGSKPESLMIEARRHVATGRWSKIWKCVQQTHELDEYAVDKSMLDQITHMLRFIRHQPCMEVVEVRV